MKTPPPLREFIAAHGLSAKKSLGQHFLLDMNITRKIVRAAGLANTDGVLEIGPGPGGLTRALLETGAQVFAIERDRRCISALETLAPYYAAPFKIIEGDALSINELDVLGSATPVQIVANLPYNISTQLLVKWLTARPALWRSMTLMFQKEVGERIIAPPGGKSYGRLSVISQVLSKPERLFDLPARAFTPPPKVASTVLHFEHVERPFNFVPELESVTRNAFGQRRKMLRSSLQQLFVGDLGKALEYANARETERAENLGPEQYKLLAKYLHDVRPAKL